MPITNNTIEHRLENMRLKKSMSLSVDSKAKMLQSIFETPVDMKPVRATASPFMFMLTRYALPVFVIAFIGLQYGQTILMRAKLALTDFNNTKTEIKLAQTNTVLRDSLLKTREDISTLKSFEWTAKNQDQKEVLVSQVSTGSKSIRNQVAALVKENKITEAKEVVLTLETALKADELYKLAPAVQSEVAATTDLRVTLEKKETLATAKASTTPSSTIVITNRIKQDKEEFANIEIVVNNDEIALASSTDLLIEAKKYLAKSEEYLNNKDAENAIIALQIYDRKVAEVKQILVK